MNIPQISEAARGPEIPGCFFIGNCTRAVDEEAAIAAYHESLPKIPLDAFRAVANRPYGFAVYCEDRYTVYAEAWVTHVGAMIAAMCKVLERDGEQP